MFSHTRGLFSYSYCTEVHLGPKIFFTLRDGAKWDDCVSHKGDEQWTLADMCKGVRGWYIPPWRWPLEVPSPPLLIFRGSNLHSQIISLCNAPFQIFQIFLQTGKNWWNFEENSSNGSTFYYFWSYFSIFNVYNTVLAKFQPLFKTM